MANTVLAVKTLLPTPINQELGVKVSLKTKRGKKVQESSIVAQSSNVALDNAWIKRDGDRSLMVLNNSTDAELKKNGELRANFNFDFTALKVNI